MAIEKGNQYMISTNNTIHFNLAEKLTVTRYVGNTVQFILDNGKGHGSIPIDHLTDLLKKDRLTLINNR